MTTTFYVPPEYRTGNTIILPDDEARHAVQVLRHQVGDEIFVVDGVGGLHRVEIREVTRKTVSGEILESTINQNEPEFNLIIGLGILKNPARFETFVEKAVELGVSGIIPLQTERTQKNSLKIERIRKILVAAMKQSGRTKLPELYPISSLGEVLTESDYRIRIVCHEGSTADRTLADIIRDDSSEITILVGPEGGFSDAEIETAKENGWQIASLGSRRLRAETAAISVAALVMLTKEP